MKALLVGIAGTSRDILLAPYVLKAYADANLSRAVEIEVLHYPHILPSKLDERCAAIVADIIQAAPDVVGFSVYCWNYDAVMQIAERVKREMPRIQILMGGPEIAQRDIDKGRFAQVPADYLIAGEGELPFANLLDALANGRIPKIQTDTLVSLRGIPSPYLTGIIPDALLKHPGICANIETLRGCNSKCAYCQYYSVFPSIRPRDSIVVLDEMEYAYQRGVRHFRFTDANFSSRRERAEEIMQALIKREIHASLLFESIPFFITPAMSDLIHEYQHLSPNNKVTVGIGLQTINAKSLKAVRRCMPIKHFTRAFDLLQKAEAIVKTDIILGLPHETLESYMQLMDYIGEVMRNGHNSLAISILRILPNSDLEQMANELGIVVARGSEHFVYETPTMPRKDMVFCEWVSAAATKVFSTLDNSGKLSLRNTYFETKNRMGYSHSKMLWMLALFIAARVSTDFVDDAEHFWYFDLPQQIPDEAIESELRRW